MPGGQEIMFTLSLEKLEDEGGKKIICPNNDFMLK